MSVNHPARRARTGSPCASPKRFPAVYRRQALLAFQKHLRRDVSAHRTSKHSIAARSTTTSTFPATRRVPLASWISIDPTANGEDAQLARPDLLHEMSDKVTGRSLLDWRLPSRPSRYFLRQ